MSASLRLQYLRQTIPEHMIKRAVPNYRLLPFEPLWYGEPNAINNAIGYAKFRNRSHDAVIPVYGDAGNVIEAHEHVGGFKEW